MIGLPEQTSKRAQETARSPAFILAEQAFSRAAGAPLVSDNYVRLLRDARENYPAWLEAINSARHTIHFESYLIHEDDAGREFAAALTARARDGVRVRVLYDWLGALNATRRRFWKEMHREGVEVRCFNPPRFDSPLGWLTRDHRKLITVDNTIAFVSGLCVGQHWVGDPARGLEPWRDTGIELRGPAVADIEAAFRRSWGATGGMISNASDELQKDAPAGDVSVRVIATEPNTTGLYHLDQLIAAGARKRLWLTDAYFVGTTAYINALRGAARDGVDVRLLVPGATDVMFISSLSRAAYRPLLEAGVRVFEWQGSMLHAKTAVADTLWARVGSTNLNIASWLGNWELDVAIEDVRFAAEMEEMYLADLQHTTEVVIRRKGKVRLSNAPEPHRRRREARGSSVGGSGGTSRTAAGVIGTANAVGAAITNRRGLGPAEARVMTSAGILLLTISAFAVLFPRLFAIPVALFCGWVGISLLIKSRRLKTRRRKAAIELRETGSASGETNQIPYR